MNIFRDRIHMTIAKGKIEYHTYKRLVEKKDDKNWQMRAYERKKNVNDFV